jgi:hypothetical protein
MEPIVSVYPETKNHFFICSGTWFVNWRKAVASIALAKRQRQSEGIQAMGITHN